MKRSHVRRLFTGVKALGAATIVAALIHCGGGTNPPAATEDVPDSGNPANVNADAGGATGVVTFPDIDLAAGISFGDSGMTDCGKQAAAKTFTLQNSSDDVINYKTSFSSGSTFYAVTPATGGVPSHGVTTITVTPQPIPAISDVTPDLYAGALDIQFPGQGPPIEVKLHQTAHGAVVTLANTAGFNLTSVKVGKTNTVPVNLSNSGNLDVTATLTLGTTQFTINGSLDDAGGPRPGCSAGALARVRPRTRPWQLHRHPRPFSVQSLRRVLQGASVERGDPSYLGTTSVDILAACASTLLLVRSIAGSTAPHQESSTSRAPSRCPSRRSSSTAVHPRSRSRDMSERATLTQGLAIQGGCSVDLQDESGRGEGDPGDGADHRQLVLGTRSRS